MKHHNAQSDSGGGQPEKQPKMKSYELIRVDEAEKHYPDNVDYRIAFRKGFERGWILGQLADSAPPPQEAKQAAEEIMETKLKMHALELYREFFNHKHSSKSSGERLETLIDSLIAKSLALAGWQQSQSGDALAFVEWINTKGIYCVTSKYQKGCWFQQGGEGFANSTEELYQLFKQSKQ